MRNRMSAPELRPGERGGEQLDAGPPHLPRCVAWWPPVRRRHRQQLVGQRRVVPVQHHVRVAQYLHQLLRAEAGTVYRNTNQASTFSSHRHSQGGDLISPTRLDVVPRLLYSSASLQFLAADDTARSRLNLPLRQTSGP